MNCYTIYGEYTNKYNISNKLLEHLSDGDTTCDQGRSAPIPIQVGSSTTNITTVQLPHEFMVVSPKPTNTQNKNWTDKFSVVVTGKNLTVKRTDSNAGWGQSLVLSGTLCPAKIKFSFNKDHDSKFAYINDLYIRDNKLYYQKFGTGTYNTAFATGPTHMLKLFTPAVAIEKALVSQSSANAAAQRVAIEKALAANAAAQAAADRKIADEIADEIAKRTKEINNAETAYVLATKNLNNLIQRDNILKMDSDIGINKILDLQDKIKLCVQENKCPAYLLPK